MGAGSAVMWDVLRKSLPALGGKSGFTMRPGSAVFGILSVLLVYRVGRDFIGAPVGLMAAAIPAVSSTHMEYSREARE